MRVEILTYDGVSEVDVVMALHALTVAGRFGGDVDVRLVTADGRPEVTGADLARLTGLEPWQPERADVLLVTGGWIEETIEKGDVPRQLREAKERGGDGLVLGGVCAGALLLGAAGLIGGRPATTHHPAFEWLATWAEVIDARIVDDGDLITAGGGPKAAFDLALYLIERELGDPRLAAKVEQFMEHDRRGTVWRRAQEAESVS